MRQKNQNSTPVNNRLAVDTNGLCELLSLGEGSAKKIASAAGAVIHVLDTRTVVYNVQKIQAYLDEVASY